MNAKADSDVLTMQIGGRLFAQRPGFNKWSAGKYKLRILWALKGGWKRHAEIKRGLLTGSIGTAEIAPRVLSRELKTLVTMEMVERRDHQVFPLKVEYRLTQNGRSFLPIIAVIHKWGLRFESV